VEKAVEVKERYRRPRRKRATDGDATPDTAPQLPEAESPDLSPDDGDADEGSEKEKGVEGPDTAPAEPSGEVDHPSALDRRVSDHEKFEIINGLWDQYIADEWEEAPERVRR